ncbi:MAG: HD domain-containing protein [Lachnospiraceae bacterium]|nr:HD domain-containing protein [Lachnospiraceae bacterium]MBQ6259337.1 HD domain-containing protein [Lachnospiraceae bacterium]
MIRLPEDVKRIISILGRAGFEAYVVGGCVRDSLLGRTPDDWDITTSALPEQVKEVFKRTIDTGIKHGTVTVRMNGKSYEVTTYRIDGKYSDGRHPDEVRFSPSLFEDLKRRDFTINAMAYNDASGVIDLFGAQRDLEKGIVRCVGDPRERFFEDSLRMLRAVRFAALLSFKIEEKTFAAIRTLAHGLSRVSEERIAAELMKIILSDHPDYLRKAYEAGLTKIFLPEFDRMMQTIQNTPHHMYTVGEHTLHVMQNTKPERVLRLSALFHDVAKPVTRKVDENGRDHFKGHPELGADMTRDILKRLKFDNATIEDTVRLVRFHDERYPVTKKNVRREIARVGMEYYPDLLALRRADILGQSDYHRKEKLSDLDSIAKLFEEIKAEMSPVTLKDLAVSGGEIIEAGVERGPVTGRVMRRLLNDVIDDPSLNTKEELIKRALSYYQEEK